MERLLAIVRVLSCYSALPAIWFGRRIRNLLWFYALASFLGDISAMCYREFFHSNSRLPGNVFYVLEILLVGFYFSIEDAIQGAKSK